MLAEALGSKVSKRTEAGLDDVLAGSETGQDGDRGERGGRGGGGPLKLSCDLACGITGRWSAGGIVDFRSKRRRVRFGGVGGLLGSSLNGAFKASDEKFSKCKSCVLMPFNSPLVGTWDARIAENFDTNSVRVDCSKLGR